MTFAAGLAMRRLRASLDRAAEAGDAIDLWWRDDDAVRDGPALDRLLRVADETGAPLALAVVPASVEGSLLRRIQREAGVAVLVHGLRHANHAPEGEKPSEFGPHRPVAELVADAGDGWAAARAAFGQRALPVFVPPWNRMAPALARELPVIGYRGLSAFGGSASAGPGLVSMDTHLDPVDWRGSRGLAAPEMLDAALARALAAGARTVGFLTHHLVFDEDLWSFCREFLALAARHAAVRLRSANDVLLCPAPSSDGLRRRASPRGADHVEREAAL